MAIGVFDSGVGGLTVHRELTRRFPDRDFVYLADQANAPYGGRPGEEVVDLTRRGYVTWNLEYRRVGLGGGWPESFDDVAAAVAAAPKLTGIEAKHMVVLGHSAGGAMALWAGGLGKDVVPGLVVGLAAMPDLVRAEEEGIGQGSVRKLLGGTRPDPSEYSPLHRLPTGTDTVIAVADGDELVPISHGKDYAAAASAAGESVGFIEIPGLHSSFLGPETAAWKDVAEAVSSRLSTPNPGPPQI